MSAYAAVVGKHTTGGIADIAHAAPRESKSHKDAKARLEKLMKERRREIAKKAASGRWA